MEAISWLMEVSNFFIVKKAKIIVRNELFNLTASLVGVTTTPHSTVAIEVTDNNKGWRKLINQIIKRLLADIIIWREIEVTDGNERMNMYSGGNNL